MYVDFILQVLYDSLLVLGPLWGGLLGKLIVEFVELELISFRALHVILFTCLGILAAGSGLWPTIWILAFGLYLNTLVLDIERPPNIGFGRLRFHVL